MLNRVLVFWHLAAIVSLSLRPSVVIGAIMRQHTAGLAIKGIDTGEEFYAQEICTIAVTILLRMEATRFDTLSDISLSRTLPTAKACLDLHKLGQADDMADNMILNHS